MHECQLRIAIVVLLYRKRLSLTIVAFFYRMDTVNQALEELLVAAQRQDCLTVGVYESAKLMNV